MGRKRSRSCPPVTSGLHQEQIWQTSDQMSYSNNTLARSNIKWGHNETKRGRSGAATNSQATSEAETGALVARAGVGAVATHDPMRLFKEALGAATNSPATSEAETGALVARAGVGAVATNSQSEPSLQGNSVGSPTHDPMRLFKEALEKLQQVTLPPELFTFAAAGIHDEHFLVSLMSIPNKSVFEFVNNRMEAFCNKGEDFV